MAQGDAFVMNNTKEQLMLGTLDLENDTLKVALLANTWTPTVDGDVMWSSVSSHEVSGAGYTAGGKTLTGQQVTQDDADNEAVFDAVDVTWAGLNVGTPGYAVLYKDTGTPTSSPVLMYWELGATATNGSDYTLRFNVEGILNLS